MSGSHVALSDAKLVILLSSWVLGLQAASYPTSKVGLISKEPMKAPDPPTVRKPLLQNKPVPRRPWNSTLSVAPERKATLACPEQKGLFCPWSTRNSSPTLQAAEEGPKYNVSVWTDQDQPQTLDLGGVPVLLDSLFVIWWWWRWHQRGPLHKPVLFQADDEHHPLYCLNSPMGWVALSPFFMSEATKALTD